MAIDLAALQAELEEEGIPQEIYYDEDELETNENFIELREQRETVNKLRFIDKLPKYDRYQNILQNCEAVPGTDGGVMVTKPSLRSVIGRGNKIGDRFRNHRKNLARFAKERGEDDFASFINVRFHYAAWIYDDLDGEPYDYTYARGSTDPHSKRDGSEEVYVGNGVLLYGLELGLMELFNGDQAFIVCQPAYAYGPLGVPPCIPPKSTIIFQVRVEGVADDFMKTFLRMDCHERRVIPLKFVLDQAEDHCMVAIEQFGAASNKERVPRTDGVDQYKTSGKNDGHFASARKSEKTLKNVIRMLECVILKDKKEQDERDVKMFHILRRRTLALRKSFAADTKMAIECGKNALKVYEGLPEDMQKTEEMLKGVNKIRYNLVNCMKRDCKNYNDEANTLLDNFDDDVTKEEAMINDNPDRERLIDLKTIRAFKKLREELDAENEKCLEAIANEFDGDEDGDYAAVGGAQKSGGHKTVKADSLNLAELAKLVDADDVEVGRPPGDSVKYHGNRVDDYCNDTSAPRKEPLIISYSATTKNETKWIAAYAQQVKGLYPTFREQAIDGQLYSNLTIYRSKADVPND